MVAWRDRAGRVTRRVNEVTYGKMNGVDAEAVRAHLARVTASQLFAGAERLCRFLRFTVESKLGGREEQLKEYALGREVFDRGESYDPRLDPIVRVEARRLRARLAEYYLGPGRGEALRLEYPKGSYVPVIHATQGAVLRTPRWVAAAIAGAFVAGAALAVFALTRPAPITMVAPIPARWIEQDDGTLDAVDAALTEAVDAALANQRGPSVVAWPEILRYRNARGTPLRDVAAQLGARQLLIISVRDLPGTKNVAVFLIDEPAGRKRLARFYSDPVLSAATQTALAARIAHDIVLARDLGSV
jgi:hypothetical protein